MNNHVQSYQFRFIDGMWRDVLGSDRVLADVLADYDLDIDYRTQFARLYDYERGLRIEFRAYSGAKIRVDIFRIEPW